MTKKVLAIAAMFALAVVAVGLVSIVVIRLNGDDLAGGWGLNTLFTLGLGLVTLGVVAVVGNQSVRVYNWFENTVLVRIYVSVFGQFHPRAWRWGGSYYALDHRMEDVGTNRTPNLHANLDIPESAGGEWKLTLTRLGNDATPNPTLDPLEGGQAFRVCIDKFDLVAGTAEGCLVCSSIGHDSGSFRVCGRGKVVNTLEVEVEFNDEAKTKLKLIFRRCR